MGKSQNLLNNVQKNVGPFLVTLLQRPPRNTSNYKLLCIKMVPSRGYTRGPIYAAFGCGESYPVMPLTSGGSAAAIRDPREAHRSSESLVISKVLWRSFVVLVSSYSLFEIIPLHRRLTPATLVRFTVISTGYKLLHFLASVFWSSTIVFYNTNVFSRYWNIEKRGERSI